MLGGWSPTDRPEILDHVIGSHSTGGIHLTTSHNGVHTATHLTATHLSTPHLSAAHHSATQLSTAHLSTAHLSTAQFSAAHLSGGQAGIHLGIALTLLAACCYAVSAALQHNSVAMAAPEGGTLRWAQLRRAVTRPRWLLGLLVQATGGALHVFALSVAPLVVVLPIGVLGIGFAYLLAVVTRQARLDRRTTIGALASMLGVGLFVSVQARHAVEGTASAAAQTRVLLVAAPLVTVLLVAALRSRGRARSPLFAIAAGLTYGTVSVLTSALLHGLREHGLAGLPVPSLAAALTGVVLGGWSVQQAYAGGRPELVVACETVVDPLLGVLTGALLLGEVPHLSPSALALELAAAAVSVTGVVLLTAKPAPTKTHRPALANPTPADQPTPAAPVVHAMRFSADADHARTGDRGAGRGARGEPAVAA